ncbi:hypothetical protein FBUS_08122, partial [Fasciolopsis buskii]
TPDCSSVPREQLSQDNSKVNSPERTSEIAAELIKLVATLYALRLQSESDQILESQPLKCRLSTTTVEKIASANSPLPSTQSSAQTRPQHSSPEVATRDNPSGPFVRLVTQGHTVLVHMGQLLGVLDDRSGFLLHRVISFDPQRVQLGLMVDLKPRDILELTEPRRTRRVTSLLNQSELASDENGGETQQIDIDTVETRANLRSKRGPLVITPGLVLIRVSQVKELAVLPYSDADSLPLPGLFNPTVHIQTTLPTDSLTTVSDSGTQSHLSTLNNAYLEDDKYNVTEESSFNPPDCAVTENEIVAPTTMELTNSQPDIVSDVDLTRSAHDTSADNAEQCTQETKSVAANRRKSRSSSGTRKSPKRHSLPSLRANTIRNKSKSRTVSFNSIVQSTPLVTNRQSRCKKRTPIPTWNTVSLGHNFPARSSNPCHETLGKNSVRPCLFIYFDVNRRPNLKSATWSVSFSAPLHSATASPNLQWGSGLWRDDPAIVCIHSIPTKTECRSTSVANLGGRQSNRRPKHRRRAVRHFEPSSTTEA